ncbi:fimbria/pilus periplasmic chaperone [Pseudomonas sp. CCM 7893]|uniref:Fimbria/pilus periplasmic chaperone n=2 Tax=Pseudomonas spelaei TaxID=1055469 RepID=A0A6I3W9Z8_9PSED|nr:fimbria/pilus periplasmic chaperone [Pseudomonas spelaei]
MLAPTAQAEISFDGYTRFIYEAGQHQVPVILVNDSNEPALAQVNLSWGDPQENRDIPMALSKPLLLIAERSKASVDIFYQGAGLPTDRESFLLLKVLSVPKKSSDENLISIALQHNLKLFYRPKLLGSPEEAIKTLRWSPSGSTTYQVRNNSPYYLTLTEVILRDPKGVDCGKTIDHLMVAPFATYELPIMACDRPVREVTYSLVSDGGTPQAYRNNVQP